MDYTKDVGDWAGIPPENPYTTLGQRQRMSWDYDAGGRK